MVRLGQARPELQPRRAENRKHHRTRSPGRRPHPHEEQRSQPVRTLHPARHPARLPHAAPLEPSRARRRRSPRARARAAHLAQPRPAPPSLAPPRPSPPPEPLVTLNSRESTKSSGKVTPLPPSPGNCTYYTLTSRVPAAQSQFRTAVSAYLHSTPEITYGFSGSKSEVD
ncbi:vegetative cell wall protein gp1-like [Leopardus geoffroyi]|uniref:vegetative cell wall protein gp1-like n=1 Tax=Leopardus geoffroyi TaxID=46844 RepID=UPI001E26117F|nr:vegetative cell wall protein gp1-like [Leopardus geoffroyi]